MTKYISIIVLFLAACSAGVTDESSQEKTTSNIDKNPIQHTDSYTFEGTEPFWNLRIKEDSIFVEMMNGDKYKGIVEVSNKSTNSGTYAIGFRSNDVYGIINKTWDNYCSYAVTEKDSLGFEIYFVFKNNTYRGCGEKH